MTPGRRAGLIIPGPRPPGGQSRRRVFAFRVGSPWALNLGPARRPAACEESP
jgi:hypothetical protein